VPALYSNQQRTGQVPLAEVALLRRRLRGLDRRLDGKLSYGKDVRINNIDALNVIGEHAGIRERLPNALREITIIQPFRINALPVLKDFSSSIAEDIQWNATWPTAQFHSATSAGKAVLATRESARQKIFLRKCAQGVAKQARGV